MQLRFGCEGAAVGTQHKVFLLTNLIIKVGKFARKKAGCPSPNARKARSVGKRGALIFCSLTYWTTKVFELPVASWQAKTR